VPIFISNFQSAFVISKLQSAHFHQRFPKRLLLSTLCKTPIFLSTLQSTCCHRHFVKWLLSSALCKASIVIKASQSKLKE
jgi:hypothetical protein